MNFPEPSALHDYRYLGDGYRERERIRKKQRRWRRKFAAMELLDKRAMLWALAESEPGVLANPGVEVLLAGSDVARAGGVGRACSSSPTTESVEARGARRKH